MEAQLMDPYTGEFDSYKLEFIYAGDRIGKIIEPDGDFSELTYDNKGRLFSEASCEEDKCSDIWIYEYEADNLIRRAHKEEDVVVDYTLYEYPSADTILALSYFQGYSSPEVFKGVLKNGNLIKILELKDGEWIETASFTYDLSLAYPSSFKNFQEVYWHEPPFKTKNLLTHGKGNYGDGKEEANFTYSFDEYGNLIQIKEADGEIYNFIYKQLP